MIQTFSNQKVITVKKVKEASDKKYISFQQAVGKAVLNDLNRIGSLKLWLYLTKNTDEYTFALSQKACEEWGITKDMYRSGVKELMQKGYLTETAKNKYEFHEIPQQNTVQSNAPNSEDMPVQISSDVIPNYLTSETDEAKAFFENRRPEWLKNSNRDDSTPGDYELPFENYDGDFADIVDGESATMKYLRSIHGWNSEEGIKRLKKKPSIESWRESIDNA